MLRFGCIAFAAAVLITPDVQQGLPAQSPVQTQILQDQSVSVLPNFDPAASGDGSAGSASAAATTGSENNSSDKSSAAPHAGPIKEESRMQIIRDVSGEFARMASPLPGGKNGFHVKAGTGVDQDALRKSLTSYGAAVYTGDRVQITKLTLRGDGVVVELNGGGRGHTSWRDHLQLGIGGVSPVQTSSSTTSSTDAAAIEQKPGATLYLDFGHPLPDMSPDELKHYLAGVLDFSKERSASVQWTSTLPAEMRQAIADKRPTVGMDRDEVLAALGRPDRKVRERTSDGDDTEDWIYGKPPEKTIFVRFDGEKVVQIDQYPR